MRLLEREHNLERLLQLLSEAGNGKGRVVLVRGEAGIGKTSLARAFATKAEEQAHLLWGACDDLLTARPLGPLWDMAFGEPEIEQALIGDDRNRVFAVLLELLTRSMRPTLMVIEDVHWADEATLDLITYLGRRIDRSHGLALLTYRDDEVGADHPLRIALGDLPRDSVERIQLAPLSEEGVYDLARDRDDAARIWQVSGGNPFFATELVASLAGTVPISIKDAVMSRVHRLSDEALQLVELVSVAPRSLELPIAEEILGQLEETVAQCEEAGILEIREGSLAFRHELARRAVESELPGIRRRALNIEILRVCEARGEDVARCAHHAREAGDAETMLRHLPLAAR